MADATAATDPRAGRRVPRAWPSARAWRSPQAWRLGSGLVLFTFALTHFLNHALGHVSLEVMEGVQAVRSGLWRSMPGSVLLYGAAAVHVGLVLWKLVRRQTWRMQPWEVVQIGLGLLIPVLLAGHVASTRAFPDRHDVDYGYGAVLRALWPGAALAQSLLLAIVWLHAMIGFHNWLRFKAWYPRWSPALLVAAALIPTLAITGWIEAARRVALLPLPADALDPALDAAKGALMAQAKSLVWLGFVLLAAALVGARMAAWFRRGPAVTYPGGRQVRGPTGATLLEVSRMAGVPHAAICGGRGRCTTCRVLVTEGVDDLSAPGPLEAAALKRIDAPPGVRLACQVRPEHALTVRPLVPHRDAEPTAAGALSGDAYRWGVERRITVMFSDLRGFTTLAERLYPYDSVFLLNRYFEVMTEAIERHGGEVDKFLGDGIMALFGVAPSRGSGSRDGLLAARDMLIALDRLNDEFDAALGERLRMGIGLHMGPAVLGRVGGGRQANLTALGDTVNVASRLESLNKEFGSALVVSEATLRAAKLAIAGAEVRDIPVRGREESLRVVVAAGMDGLDEANPAPSATAERVPVGSGSAPKGEALAPATDDRVP